MKKILVLGKNGQLGRALQRLDGTNRWKFLDRDALDLAHTEVILDKLTQEDFDVLINAAAYTLVDKAEDEPLIAHKINAEALAPMAEACRLKNALLVHVSTDYVFGDVVPIPITETQPTAPKTAYGKSKLAGEEIISSNLEKYLIIRTSWLYGAWGHNFLNTMLKLGVASKPVNVVFDQIGTPTFVDHLAKAIFKMIHWDKMVYGIYHYSNEGVCSWYDFAHAIFELANLKVRLSPADSSAFAVKAQRPHYSVLNKQKIKDNFGLEIAHWRDALASCFAQIENLE